METYPEDQKGEQMIINYEIYHNLENEIREIERKIEELINKKKEVLNELIQKTRKVNK